MPENKILYHFSKEMCYTMKVIDAAALDYKTLNEALRQPEHSYVIQNCCGQRFIGAGMSDRKCQCTGCSR